MFLSQILLCTFSVTQSLFLLGFSWSPDNITARNKKSTSKKEPTSVSEISYNVGKKYYNSTSNLSMWVVYQHECLKIQLCIMMWFFTSFDITWYAEAAIYAKNLLFSLWNWQCDKFEWGEKCHYQVTCFLNGPISNLLFFCHIDLYWEKVTSYGKFSQNLTLEVQIVWKTSAF